MGKCFKLKRYLINFSWKGIIGLTAFLLTLNTYANPVLNNVSAGNAVIQQTPNSTVVNQSSQRAVINWRSFNINQQESVHFQQPAGGVALNRIDPTSGVSSIYGKLTATGQIILINPAGIYFSPSAFVNVGGLIATTRDLSDRNFLSGQYSFTKSGNYNGAIINEGQIIASNHGLVALVGANVTNKGFIQANLGHIVLASGDAFTMNFSGNELINFKINAKTSSRGADQNGQSLNDGVNNSGKLIANGGTVLVTAEAAKGVLDNVINMSGVVEAKSVAEQNGEIIFSGDTDDGVVRVAGDIDASGYGSGETGGNIDITGYNILIDSPAKLDVSGYKGGGQIQIGGNYQGKGPLPNANAVVAMPGSLILADATEQGNGGKIILWSDNVTKAYGKISARGGVEGGDGGFVETSGHKYLDVYRMQIDLKAPLGKTGMWLLDPSDLTISNGATTNVTATGVPTNTFTADNNSNTSVLNVTDLTNALANSSVTVLTTAGGSGTGNGDISVVDPISWASTNTLIINALRDIIINAAISGSGGALQLIAGRNLTSVANLSTNSGLTVDVSGTASNISGLISGNGGFTKQGLGTLTLNNANTYTGATNISAGTVNLGVADALATDVLTTINGTLNLTGNSQTFLGLSGSSTGQVLNTGAMATLTLNNNATSTTFSGVIDGSISLVKLNPGEAILNNTNTYTGTTTVTNGSLTLTAVNAIPIDNVVVVDSTINMTANQQFSDLSGSGQINAPSSATLTLTPTGTSTYNGILTGDLALTLSGTGTFVITNTGNSYVNATTINSGTLRLGASGVIDDRSSVILANTAGATFDLNGNDETVLSLTGGGTTGGNVTLGGGTLTVVPSGLGTTVYAGSMSGNGGFTMSGSSSDTQELSGNNSYLGTTTVNSGTLLVSNANALGSTVGGTVVNSGAILNLNGVTVGNEAVNLNGATLLSTGTSALGGAITLGSSTSNTINAPTSLTLSGNINGDGDVSLVGGDISLSGNIGNGTALTSLTASNSNLSLSGSIINTVGDQVYDAVTTLASNISLGVQGNSSVSHGISFNNGIFGNMDLSLAGTGGFDNYTFSISGPLTLNNVSITGTAGGNNSFALNTGNPTTFTITGTDISSIAATGVTGTFTATNIQNLTGGTDNDTFQVSGGTLNGTVNGGGGTNNLVGDNVVTSWNVTGTNTGNTTSVNGFTNIQSLTAGSADDTFTLNGGTISGTANGGGGTNTFIADNVNNTWTVTSTDSGTVTGTGAFVSIQNLTGGSANDSFSLSGGTIAGSIVGGGGTNAINGDNVTSNWNINGINSGTATGIGGTFSDIQSLTGGNSGNNSFTFADGARLDGSINGGSLNGTNTLNFANLSNVVNIILTDTYSGSARSNAQTVTSFSNINNYVANSKSNIFTLPSGKSSTLNINGAGTGTLNDPATFSGFRVFQSTSGSDTVTFSTSAIVDTQNQTAVIDGVTLFFVNFGVGSFTGGTSITSVASVIQQPNSNSDGNKPTSTKTAWNATAEAITENIDSITQQAANDYDTDLAKVKVNPYCLANQ